MTNPVAPPCVEIARASRGAVGVLAPTTIATLLRCAEHARRDMLNPSEIARIDLAIAELHSLQRANVKG